MTPAKLNDPSQVYYSLKTNIDAAANFSGTVRLGDAEVSAAKISSRELQVAIPAGTTPAQWNQISKAVQYGQSQGGAVKITMVKP